MLIYKIFEPEGWATLEDEGVWAGTQTDLTDGFIHFSTAAQAPETAAKHFAGRRALTLAAVETDGLDALAWEAARGGDLFPHLYAPLVRSAVVWARSLPLGPDGRHIFPDGM